MVHTYYEIGRIIVEDEQQGRKRAEYGKQVLRTLSKRLTHEFGKKFGADAPFLSDILNSQKSSAKSQLSENKEIISPKNVLPKFVLSWSHYLKLMRIENPDERKLYEIECAENNWSLKELQRQFDSALSTQTKLFR